MKSQYNFFPVKPPQCSPMAALYITTDIPAMDNLKLTANVHHLK